MNSPTPSATTLAALILFYEKPRQTIECVASLLPSRIPIYILNNGSSEPATRIVEDYTRGHPHIMLWHAPRNLGVAAGRNLLIARTREPWLFFLDSDAYVKTPDWLPIVAQRSESYPEVEAFFPRLFNVHEPHDGKAGDVVIEDGVMSTRQHSNPVTNLIAGGACIVQRALFERLGAYDEELFVGFEDIEMAVRAIKLGAPIRSRYLDEIEVIHEHRPAESEADKTAARERYRLETIRSSYTHLLRKHNLRWDHEWERWIQAESARIAGPERRPEEGTASESTGWRRLLNRVTTPLRAITSVVRGQ